MIMRRALSFGVCFLLATSFKLYSQAIFNRSNASSTAQDARLKALLNFVLPTYYDTTAANLQKGLDSCGAQFYCYSTKTVWLRRCSPKVWVEIGRVSWGSITGTLSSQTDLNTALGTKEPSITAGTTAQYWRGDKSFQTLNSAAVGLGNVTNESKATMFTSPTFTGTVSGVTASMVGLANVTNESKATMFTSPTFTGTVSGITWGVITGTLSSQTDLNTALGTKEPSITAGTTAQYWRGDKSFQTLNSAAVGLGNVTNESKATMFTSPTFTGTVSGVTASMVGLANVTNESKATMFASPTFTGTVAGVTASMVGLGNVTNESKATMFTSPTFTGTVSGITWGIITGTLSSQTDLNTALGTKEPSITAGTTAQYWRGDKSFQTLNSAAVGLGNVTNESKATMFTSPTFTGTVSGVTASMVGLANVTNESKATMFASPTFTGTVAGVTASMVGLGNVTNESKATMFTSPTFTGTVAGVTASMVGLGNVTNESKVTMFTSPTFTGAITFPANQIGIPVYGRVTGSNFTTTGQVLVNITGLSVALIANSVYEFESTLSTSVTAVTTGNQYGVQYSAAGAAVEGGITGALTSTASKTERINALNTATSAYLTTSAQTGQVILKGIMTTGANAGNITIQCLKNTSGTCTVFINSLLKVTRIQ